MVLDKRFIFAAALVLGFGMAACDDGGSDDSADKGQAANCGDGVLQDIEECDGDLFKDGKKACPDGTKLKDGKTVNDIKCKTTCVVNLEDVCMADSSGGKLADGAECKDNTECKSNNCKASKCAPAEEGGDKLADGKNCTADAQCQSGKCKDSQCAPTEEGGNKLADGEKCTANAQCQSGKCKASKCAPAEEGGDKLADGKNCTADAQCQSGKCKDSQCAPAEEGGDGVSCQSDDDCPDKDVNKWCDPSDNVCKSKPNKPATCNDGTLDKGEFCDSKNNKTQFTDESKATCDAYIKLSLKSDPSLYSYNKEGKPGCSSDCLGYNAGTCDVKQLTCGNEKIEDGEKCETVGGVAKVLNEKGEIVEATCLDVNGIDTTKTYTGKPECNENCSGINKGNCKVDDGNTEPDPGLNPLNGYKSCKLEGFKHDEAAKKVEAKVTVVLDAETGAEIENVSSAVVCGLTDVHLGGLIAKVGEDKEQITQMDKGADGSFTKQESKDVSKLTAGENGCVVFVVNTDNTGTGNTGGITQNGVLCSTTGAVSTANIFINTVPADSVVKFTVK